VNEGRATITTSGTDLARVVLVDKPVGPTSFDIVRSARRGLRAKVGHSGTLDPFASGLLLVLVGQATRLSSLMMDLPKEYLLTAQFGATSSTADPTGELRPSGVKTDARAVLAALDAFRGRIMQRVPLTSAVKVDGEPLYRRAHRGETVETPEREVMVYELSLLTFDEESQSAEIVARTGRGTYVRTLAEGLGEVTGAGAYASTLRRTRIGAFSVEDALRLEDLSPERYQAADRAVLSLNDALGFLPRLDVSGRDARLAANGNGLEGGPAGRFRVYGPGGLLGVWEGPAGLARPAVVFPAPVPEEAR